VRSPRRHSGNGLASTHGVERAASRRTRHEVAAVAEGTLTTVYQAEALAGIVKRLRVRQPEIEETILLRMLGAVKDDTSLGSQDVLYQAGLRDAVSASVEYYLTEFVYEEESPIPVPQAVITHARRAADRGVGLDTVLRGYSIGHAVLGECVLTEADKSPYADQNITLRRSGRHTSMLERFTATIADEYKCHRARLQRTSAERVAECVLSLLAGTSLSQEGLDYDLGGWHVGAIAKGPGAGMVVNRAATSGQRVLTLEREDETIWAWYGSPAKVSITGLKDASLNCALLVVGEPAVGLHGFRYTHLQAQDTLRVALHREDSFTRYADVVLEGALLCTEARAQSLVEIYLRPLDDDSGRGSIRRETLRAYFKSGRNAATAAHILGIDRRTVWYRLRGIEACLGYTLEERLPELELALRIEDLQQGNRLRGRW
jgi:hypothetical protein